MKKAFTLIGDLLSFEQDDYVIDGGYTLKRPDKNQIEIIRGAIEPYSILFDSPFKKEFVNRYELEVIETDKEGSFQNKELPEDKFRYSIIEYPNNTPIDRKLNQALLLSELGLRTLFHFSYHGAHRIDTGEYVPDASIGTSGHQAETVAFFQDTQYSLNWPIEKFKSEDVIEINSLLKTITDFEAKELEFDFISKALKDFNNLSSLPRKSALGIVGIFACLELLVVDGSQEKLNSINQQLQRKLTLLNNRFEKKIDFTSYFKGPDTLTLGKVIETLYNYRSSIAHGNFLDFEKKLNLLNKVQTTTISDFLMLMLKRVIEQSLKEPQLIADLKNC